MVHDSIIKIANEIRNNKLNIIQQCINDNEPPPRFDTRDFTDKNLIYGIRYSYIVDNKEREDFESFNLGSCLTYDSIIPDYKFVRFKDLYDTFCDLVNECECSHDIRKLPIKLVMEPMLHVLSCNSKYYRTIFGKKCGYRICIFLYNGWEYRDNLSELARQFRKRDLEEAKAISNYFNSRLIEACTRIKGLFK